MTFADSTSPAHSNVSLASSVANQTLTDYIWRVFKRFKKWSKLEEWRPTLDELNSLAEKIQIEFTTATAAESAKVKGDDYMAHDIYFI